MRCPSCNSMSNKVVDSRPLADFDSIKRRRKCSKCGVMWLTAEVPLKEPQKHVAKIVERVDRQEYRVRAAVRLLKGALEKLEG